MLKTLVVASLFMAGHALAQDVSSKEDYKSSHIELADGSTRYVGKCSTHEDYENVLFKTDKVLQSYVSPSDMTDAQIERLLAKLDSSLLAKVFKKLELDKMDEKAMSNKEILKEYVDDITVEKISSTIFPELQLVRFNVGVGGGNGAYLVFNQTVKAEKTTYKLMSYTFDADLNYCDRAVWLQ
jgi:hypothetical protein